MGKQINWLVDSGSDLTLLWKTVVEIKLPRTCAERINSHRPKFIEQTFLTLKLNGCYIMIQAQIVDHIPDQAILGVDSPNQFKSLLNKI